MKRNFLKLALLSLATFSASAVAAQDTYVLYGTVGEGEVKLSTQREQANDGAMTLSDYKENDKVVGFTQTITGQGNWFLSYDWFGSEIDPAILKATEYNLVYDVRTSWSGDVKLKFEVQTKGATEKLVTFDHDGEWHTITIPVQDWVADNILQTIESSSRVMFGFVGGGWNVTEPTTIDYRNVKLVPVNVVPDTEAPTWASDPTAKPGSTTASITVAANDNVSRTLTYEISTTNDFSNIYAKANGVANTEATINLTGLTAATDYTFYVRAKDAAGNVSEVKTVTFTTTDVSVEPVFHGTITASDYSAGLNGWAPTITYSITYQEDKHLLVDCIVSEFNDNNVQLNLEDKGQFETMNMVDGNNCHYSIVSRDTYEEGTEFNNAFFYLAYPNNASRANFKYVVGDSNAKPSDDTTAPEWNADPVAQNVTDKTAEIVVKVTDDSGSAVITLTGDNFSEVKKTVKADGSEQVIALTGLTAETAYNLTLALADASGNAAESKTVAFTTEAAPNLDVLYQRIEFTSADWRKNGENNTFAPNGNILIAVNADNTVTMKVTVDEGADLIDNSQCILHGIDTFSLTSNGDGVFEGTSTTSINNRDASQAFHLNFVLKEGKGNSEYKVTYFTPSAGSTSAVAEVETEAVKVIAANGAIRVDGDKAFEVYTVAGQLAFSGKGEARLDKGVYVVVVDNRAVKVML